ncbi:hypothetical protein [Aureicoccus marinus]|uniref:Uncharacterized protein n=1 Tax=Aureicoccus marinus TaxID=754435 RepID=A0A2S7T8A7_9FLAO|nr:hypothetical protein [Aureicoccus marinus]PQJ15735.1 hypothetical protein BST99_08340 [Aureicoccus marinus]
MKNALIAFVVLLVSTQLKAQDKKEEVQFATSKTVIQKVEFTVDTVKEMNEVDWDDIFGVFKENAAQDSIEVAVVLKNYKVKNEKDVIMTIPRLRVAVSGQTKDTTELRAQMIRNVEKTTSAIRKFKS